MKTAPLTLVLIAGSALVTSGAAADVVAADFTDSSNYHYQILHMPDLDQRRNGLDNGGNMHCVPTAAMNLMVYIANHGFPSSFPLRGNYQGPTLYNHGTAMINLMGSYMSTSGTTGTNGNGQMAGLDEWLFSGYFTWSYQFASGTYSPSQVQITQSAINGSLIMYCFGRYTILGFNNGVPVLNRDSGHCVTLSRSFRSGSTRWFWVRDPGRDDGDPSVQSLFANSLHDNLQNFNVQVGTQQRNMLSIDWPQSDNRYRLIDSFARISTKQGYSFTDTGVQVMNPYLPVGTGGNTFTTHNASHNGATINQIAVSPDANHFWSLQTDNMGLKSLCVYDPILAESTRIAPTAGAKDLVFGRKRGLYVLMPQAVVQYDVDQVPPVVVGAASLTSPVDAIACDDHFDQVVLLSNAAHAIIRYNDNLAGSPIVHSIPSSIPMSGNAQMVINPTDESVWFRTDAMNKLYRATLIPVLKGADVNVEEISIVFTGLESFDIDSGGNLFVNDNGNIREFHRNATTGNYDEVASDYAGFPIGNHFQIARSRTNFDPFQHSGPGWNNINPDELFDAPNIADCVVDIAPQPVPDGDINVSDLLAVINAWGPCTDPANCPADISPLGGDGSVDVSDLLLVINNWGACP